MANSVLTKMAFRRLALLVSLFFLMPPGCFFLGEPDKEQGARPRREQAQTRQDRAAETQTQAAAAAEPRGVHPAEAEQVYAQARSLWGQTSEACTDPQQAVVLLDRALAIAPDYGDAYLRRGLAKSQLGDFDGAFEDVTSAVRLRPTAEAYAFRGLVLIRGGELKAARRDLEYSLSRDKAQHRAVNYLGVLAMSEDNTKEACASFEEGCARGDCFFLETARKKQICP